MNPTIKQPVQSLPNTHRRVDDPADVTYASKNSGLRTFLTDYTGVSALVLIAVAWGVMSSRTDNNADEIKLLRAKDELRSQRDAQLLSVMATRADIQQLSESFSAQFSALRSEMRTQRR